MFVTRPRGGNVLAYNPLFGTHDAIVFLKPFAIKSIIYHLLNKIKHYLKGGWILWLKRLLMTPEWIKTAKKALFDADVAAAK